MPSPYPDSNLLEPADAGMPPSSTPSQGFDIGGALMSLGTALGGVAQVQSGGRLPNAAAQIQLMYQQRQQHEIENKIRSAALQMQQQKAQQDAEKFKLDKLTTSWKAVHDITDSIGDLDEQKARALGAKIAGDYAGDPELADVFSQALQSSGKRKALESLFPRVLKEKGFDATMQIFKDPQLKSQLPKLEQGLQRDETVKTLTDLIQRGVISKDASMADITKVVPGVSSLEDKDLLMLNQMGMKNAKSKGVAEAEAKAQIESKAQQNTQARFEQNQNRMERAMQQSAAQFQQSQASMEDRFQRRLDVERQQRERLSPSQVKQVTGNKQALAIIDEYEKAHTDLMKETKGQIPAVFKGVLTKNQKAKTLADISGLTGQTASEQKFAGEYNALIASLKTLTDEVGVLTDQDAVRILNSFDPAVTPGQFRANISARRKVHQRSVDMLADTLESQGKNVSGIRRDTSQPKQADPLGIR